MLKARHTLPLLAALTTVAVTTPAAADQLIIKNPGDHPDYHVDIEPHGILGGGGWWDWGYYGLGLGGGARFSIPLCKNCFVPKINNNVAISFGADLAFYPWANGFAPAYLFLPVAMQWNFFISKKWSVGPEIGFTPTIGVFYDYNYCNAIGGPCHNFYPYFSCWAVGRYHFSEKVALTMRLGFPELFNIGVSFFL